MREPADCQSFFLKSFKTAPAVLVIPEYLSTPIHAAIAVITGHDQLLVLDGGFQLMPAVGTEPQISKAVP